MDVAVAATTDRIHDRARELGATGLVADLTDPAEVERLAGEAGAVDVLVCNAGMAQSGAEVVEAPFLALDPAAWETELARTLSTAFLIARAIAPGMVERGYGRIVMVSSITGPRTAIPGSAAYGAAKAGMEGLMRGMALELAPRGVTVNAVAPGWIATASSRPRKSWRRARGTPIGRPGHAGRGGRRAWRSSRRRRPPTSPGPRWSSTAAARCASYSRVTARCAARRAA